MIWTTYIGETATGLVYVGVTSDDLFARLARHAHGYQPDLFVPRTAPSRFGTACKGGPALLTWIEPCGKGRARSLEAYIAGHLHTTERGNLLNWKQEVPTMGYHTCLTRPDAAAGLVWYDASTDTVLPAHGPVDWSRWGRS